MSYNQQAAVDQKHNLVIGTHTINRNDRNALSEIAIEAKKNIESEGFTALVDKGYHNGKEIQTTQTNGIITVVAIPEIANSNAKRTSRAYMVDEFIYHKESDTYTCPQGEILSTKGTWHTKKKDENTSYQFKKYRTPKCKECPVRHLCTAKADGSREIERSEYAEAVAINKVNYLNNKDSYRKRQEINEHIFGTIKRQWGFKKDIHVMKCSKKAQIDLVFMKSGIKKQVTEFEEGAYFCKKCKKSIMVENMRILPQYGHNLMLWSVNQKIQYKLSTESIINY